MSRPLRSFANRRIPSLRVAVVFASLVAAIAPKGWAADALDVIVKAIKAIGGEARLAKGRATTSKVKSTFISADNPGVSKIEHTTDGLGRMRIMVESDFAGNKFTDLTVIDGDKGWRKEGEMEVIELEGEELADIKWSIFWQSVPFTLVELKDSKFKIESVDDEKVGDKPAAGVKVTAPRRKGLHHLFR